VLLTLFRAPLMEGVASAEASASRIKEIQDTMGPDFADRLARGQVSAEEVRRFNSEIEASGAAVGMAVGGLMLALLGILAWAVLGLILFGIVVPLTQGALTVAIADRLLGGERGWPDYWKVLVVRLGKILPAVLLVGVSIFIGICCLFIPGLLAGFFFSLVPIVVMVEGVGGLAALKRSFQLVKSDWLRVLLVSICFGVMYIVATILGGLLIPDRFVFLDTLVGNLLFLVLLPFPVTAAVLLYLDIRRTKEHVDREALQAELDGVRTPA
jgi:hypothetical protein